MAGSRAWRAIAVALLAGQGAVALWLAWRSLGWPLIHDAPIMHYIAWRITGGAVPYRDLFDMNFPGVYLVHLAVVTLLGPGDAAWRAFDLGVTVLASLAVGALAAPWGRMAAVGGATFFAAYHLASGPWNAGQRDLLLCPCLLAGALGVVRWAEGGGLRAVFGGGVALGAGLTIKPHAVVFVAALLVFVGVCAHGRATRWRAPWMALLAGAVLAPLAVFVWLAAVGALGPWRDIVVGYLIPLYSRVARPSDWLYFRWHALAAAAAMLAMTLARVTWTRRWSARHAVVVLGAAYGVVHFVAQRKGWEYHLYPFAAFAAVLFLAELGPVLKSRRRLVAVALLAVMLAMVGFLWVKGAEAVDTGWIAQKERRVSALAADLRLRARPGDLVQVLDTTEGGIHTLLRLGLVGPTRFIYDFHFFHHTDAPMIQRLRAELVRGLLARPPALVVLWERGWPVDGYERLDEFPALKDLLGTGYVMAHEGDGYRIYAKRHDT